MPLDLTQDALRERGLSVDEEGFETAMEKQRAEARANWSGSGQTATETIWFDIRQDIGMTEFVGYQGAKAEAKISAIIIDGQPTDKANAGQEASVIVNQTPFYAESGGQAGDQGTMSALVKSNVGSFSGTSGLDARALWSCASKYLRKDERMSAKPSDILISH